MSAAFLMGFFFLILYYYYNKFFWMNFVTSLSFVSVSLDLFQIGSSSTDGLIVYCLQFRFLRQMRSASIFLSKLFLMHLCTISVNYLSHFERREGCVRKGIQCETSAKLLCGLDSPMWRPLTWSSQNTNIIFFLGKLHPEPCEAEVHLRDVVDFTQLNSGLPLNQLCLGNHLLWA